MMQLPPLLRTSVLFAGTPLTHTPHEDVRGWSRAKGLGECKPEAFRRSKDQGEKRGQG